MLLPGWTAVMLMGLLLHNIYLKCFIDLKTLRQPSQAYVAYFRFYYTDLCWKIAANWRFCPTEAWRIPCTL